MNLFKQSINIFGALYICICFLASTKSLQVGQYQALSSARVSDYSKSLKQSCKVVSPFLIDVIESSDYPLDFP